MRCIFIVRESTQKRILKKQRSIGVVYGNSIILIILTNIF